MAGIQTLFLTIALALAPALAAAQSGDPVKLFAEDDLGMNAAVARANKSLPMFLQEFTDPASKASMFALKVAMPFSENGTEHIWVDTLESSEAGYNGRLANEPTWLEMKRGDSVSFDATMISDWSYWLDDKLHGNYTTRVLLPQLTPEEAVQLSALLAPLPEDAP